MVDPNESNPEILWAEIHRLRSESTRCITARNRLNEILHGPGALIDSLEEAVESVARLVEPIPEISEETRKTFEAISDRNNSHFFTAKSATTAFDQVDVEFDKTDIKRWLNTVRSEIDQIEDDNQNNAHHIRAAYNAIQYIVDRL